LYDESPFVSVFHQKKTWWFVNGCRCDGGRTRRTSSAPCRPKPPCTCGAGCARREHDEPTGEEREQHREERRDDAAGALVERKPLPRRSARRRPARDRRFLGGRSYRARLPRAAGHPRSRALPRSRPDRLAGDLPLVDDEDAVGERDHLLELERDEQNARPSSRSSTSRLCTNSIAPTSRPRVG